MVRRGFRFGIHAEPERRSGGFCSCGGSGDTSGASDGFCCACCICREFPGGAVSRGGKPELTEQPAYSVPTPGVIPQSSAEHTAAQTSASGALNVQAAPDSAANLLSFNNEVPVASAQKPEKERRYFTAAHIAICLAVTGVMAAAAGIFAGLYFSTIL